MTSKTLKSKKKLVTLPHTCFCGSKKGIISLDNDDSCDLYILSCVCGHEFDHSTHKELLGRKT